MSIRAEQKVMFLLLAIASAAGTGQAQDLPREASRTAEPAAVYSRLFHEVLNFEARADHLAAQGRADAAVRHHHQNWLGLTAEQEAQLKRIAADWGRQDAPLEMQASYARADLGRLRRESTAAAVASREKSIAAIAAQQVALVRSGVASLAELFGPLRFASFEGKIRQYDVTEPAFRLFDIRHLNSCEDEQVPTSLAIIPPDYTGPFQGCAWNVAYQTTKCGVGRVFFYQVLDQNGQSIQQALPISDQITAWQFSNGCNMTEFALTPPGTTTYDNGTFIETLTICASNCCAAGVCTAACDTGATQVWTVGAGTVTKLLDYQCDQITVSGQ